MEKDHEKDRYALAPEEPFWDEPEESTFYDRKMDLQGEVPGGSLEEAKIAFEREYGIPLNMNMENGVK